MSELSQPLVNPIQNYILETCVITTHNDQKIDLKLLYAELNFYESIFSPVLLGSILVPDYFNYNTYGPLIGGEEIEIKIRNIPAEEEGGSREKQKEDRLKAQKDFKDDAFEYFYHTFTILSVENRVVQQNRLQLYEIKFCSKETIFNQQLRLSTTFLKKPYSKIAKDVMRILFSEMKKLCPEERKDKPERKRKELDLLSEKEGNSSSEPSVSVHFPNLHPFDCIQYLMGKAVNGTKGNPYFFYESFNRKFYFGSFKDHFYFNHSKEKYLNVNDVKFTEGNKIVIFNNNQISIIDSPFTHKKVDFYSSLHTAFPKDFDYLENVKKGVYAHRLFTYDYTKKQFKKHEFSFKRDYSKIPHIYSSQDKALMIKDGARQFKSPFYTDTFIKTAFTHEGLFFPGEQDLSPQLTKNYRYEKFQELNNNFFELTIPGDIGCFAGKFFDLYLNSPDVTTSEKLKSDPHFSGTYFCLQIHHCFKQENFVTSLELCKDSFMEKTLQVFPSSEK